MLRNGASDTVSYFPTLRLNTRNPVSRHRDFNLPIR